jgi:hypothetical protein
MQDRPTHQLDGETVAAIEGAFQLPLGYQNDLRGYIRERHDALHSGLIHVPDWAQRAVKEVSSLLRLRWSFEDECYVLEQWGRQAHFWIIICRLVDDQEQPQRLGPVEVFALCEELKANDIRRYSSREAWLRSKRERAAHRRAQLDRQRTGHLLDVIGDMSGKQVSQFIDVHHAMRSGEQIRVLGSDAKKLEGAQKAKRDALAAGIEVPDKGGSSRAINPGMHPSIYERITPEAPK